MLEKALVEKIDFSKSEQYTLSIRLSTDGFSFSIYNPIHDSSLIYLPQPMNMDLPVAANIRELLKSDILQYPYKRVNVLQVSKRFTLYPFELLENEEHYDPFFHYNHPKKENEVVLCNELIKANMKILFGMDQTGWQLLSEHFPKARFYSQSSPLIEYFVAKCRLGNSKKMYVYVRGNSLDVFCFDRGRLLLANSFAGNHVEDAIYYLLYIWKQLDYAQERDELHLVGTFHDKEKLIAGLRRFIRQLFIINPKSEFNHPALTRIEDIPFDLQTLLLCEI